MRIGSLFSGSGILDMAVECVIGGRTAWQSEVDPSASKVLSARWDCPNIGDVTTADWSSLEPVEVLCGGFPCQDLSTSGLRAGIAHGTRSGLWHYFAEAVDSLRPSLVIIENVEGLLHGKAVRVGKLGLERPDVVLRAAGAVLGDLADLGYDARWSVVSAASAGACHRRKRVFVVAHPSGIGVADQQDGGDTFRQSVGAKSGAGRGDSQRAIAERVSLMGGATTELAAVNWGKYLPAVRHWETITRPAPPPTTSPESSTTTPEFEEWLMGWPKGYVTDLPIPRTQMKRIIENGVVPQQVGLALDLLGAADLVCV